MKNIKFIFRSLHIVWAIIGISVTLVLANSTKGHPPGIVFVPVALGIWVVGHAFLWLGHVLAKRGKKLAETRESASGEWPLTLVILAFVFGGIFIFGIFAIGLQSLFGNNNSQNHLPDMLLLWLPPSICFVGIMLRQTWSRHLASGIFFAAAIFLLYRVIQSLGHPPQYVSALEWVVVTLVLISFLFLGQHIFRSSRIRAFFSK
jgi:hypothetical protein